eukprot:GHVR01099204.1.p1 GENE.GHVR01099204.1~~GHVR01099204.1.p1  ORF type:complete len:198 (-),score=28.18 GHVR01099204.1:262-855(-)
MKVDEKSPGAELETESQVDTLIWNYTHGLYRYITLSVSERPQLESPDINLLYPEKFTKCVNNSFDKMAKALNYKTYDISTKKIYNSFEVSLLTVSSHCFFSFIENSDWFKNNKDKAIEKKQKYFLDFLKRESVKLPKSTIEKKLQKKHYWNPPQMIVNGQSYHNEYFADVFDCKNNENWKKLNWGKRCLKEEWEDGI